MVDDVAYLVVGDAGAAVVAAAHFLVAAVFVVAVVETDNGFVALVDVAGVAVPFVTPMNLAVIEGVGVVNQTV